MLLVMLRCVPYCRLDACVLLPYMTLVIYPEGTIIIALNLCNPDDTTYYFSVTHRSVIVTLAGVHQA